MNCSPRSALGKMTLVRGRFRALWLLAFGLAPALAMGQETRAIGVVPLAESQPQNYSAQRDQSYGVFVGVDQFPEDDSITPLKYAAKDARAVRDCFVNDLKYMPAENARLLVTGAEGRDRPTRENILEAITVAAQKAGPDGCAAIYLSTHGYKGYVLAETSRRAILDFSAIALKSIEEILAQSRSPRRLLVFDACREVLSKGEKALGGGMSPEFAQAFQNAEGFAVLMSCGEGQYSYEMPENEQGAFTHFLLEGLRGGAPANPDGLVTVTGLSRWVQKQVEDWSRGRPAGVQSPRFDLRQATGDLPLALSKVHLQAEEQMRAEMADAAQKLSQLFAQGVLSAEQHALVQSALASKDPQRQKVALDVASAKLAPNYIDQLLAAPALQATPAPTPAAVPTAAPSPSATPAAAPTPAVEPSPSPAVAPSPPPAVSPAGAANRAPVIDGLSLLQEVIDASSEFSFEVAASDPDGDRIAKYCYRLDGQNVDSVKTTPKISMSRLRPGKRTLTVAVEDERGARSEPKSVSFTVQESAAPTPPPAAPTPERPSPASSLAGRWKLNVEKSRDSVQGGFREFMDKYCAEQGLNKNAMPPEYNAMANMATQQFESIVWAGDSGAILTLSTSDGRSFQFNFNNPVTGGNFSASGAASSDGKRLTVSGLVGQQIALELQSANTIRARISYNARLAASMLGYSPSTGLTVVEYWDRLK